MKLADLKSATKTTVISFDVGDLKVTYKPNAFTANLADQINAAMQDPAKQTDGMFRMVSEVLVDWDLEDDGGKIIPVDDIKRLRDEVPMQVFGLIFQGIQQDQDPGKADARS
jgi:hypothetical protein